jgi:hypothetical protein
VSGEALAEKVVVVVVVVVVSNLGALLLITAILPSIQ